MGPVVDVVLFYEKTIPARSRARVRAIRGTIDGLPDDFVYGGRCRGLFRAGNIVSEFPAAVRVGFRDGLTETARAGDRVEVEVENPTDEAIVFRARVEGKAVF